MKQIIIKNNVIEIYNSLKNDTEKAQFLLKIFKFLLENEQEFNKFKTKEKINFAFLGIKPSLKLLENNWGGSRNRLNNQENNFQVDTQVDKQVESKSLISNKEYKNKEIKNKDNNNMQDEKKENDYFITYDYCEKLYNDMKFTFDLKEFWLYYKEKAIFKKDCSLKMYQWQKRLDEKKEKELKEQKEQEIIEQSQQEKDKQELLKYNADFKKVEYDYVNNVFYKIFYKNKDDKIVIVAKEKM